MKNKTQNFIAHTSQKLRKYIFLKKEKGETVSPNIKYFHFLLPKNT
jgi:hypothetical protein